MTPKIEEFYREIAMSVYNELPEVGWRKVVYIYQVICGYSSQNGYFLSSEGQRSKTFVIDGAGFDALLQLRDEMAAEHASGQAWYTANFLLAPDGKFSFDFDYDHLPTFDIMPDPEDWLEEFKKYPRPELQAQIQDWIDGRVPDKDWRLMVERLAQLAS
jgi:hypothetical protein